MVVERLPFGGDQNPQNVDYFFEKCWLMVKEIFNIFLLNDDFKLIKIKYSVFLWI